MRCPTCSKIMVVVGSTSKLVYPAIHEDRLKCFGCGYESIESRQDETPRQRWDRINGPSIIEQYATDG